MITFHTSEELNRLHEAEAIEAYPTWTPPSKEELESRRDNYERIWAQIGSALMAHMEQITGLTFEPHIECYVLSGTIRDHSRPLVLKSRYTEEEFIVALCHELTHRLMSGSEHAPLPFPNESQKVRNHVMTYAILSLILSGGQLKVARNTTNENYKRAWDIIDRDGADKIIKDFRKAN
ncbi:MAG: hypothetical protein NUW02_00580 [Candidatus Campbellbacteria bacterium]|nr:hypothetical protein [Candidatus Campbellbacteria bacterium]